MTKQEFASRTSRPFTEEDYKIVEKVYTFHPCIDSDRGKDQIASLHETFGMRVILDMLPTAEKAEELENKIIATKHELEALTAALFDLKSGR